MKNVFKLNGTSLEHYIDDQLRAVIPTAGQSQYGKDWPAAASFLAANQPATTTTTTTTTAPAV